MGDYFKLWRRKVGVVTLVMACVFTAVWIRSINRRETAAFSVRNNMRFQIFSQNGNVKIRIIVSDFPVRDFFGQLDKVILLKPFFTSGVTREHAVPIDEKMLIRDSSRWNLTGYGFVVANFKQEILSVRVSVWIVPYWLLVIPLTLVSAYLLLSKPRKSTSKKITEPITTEGT